MKTRAAPVRAGATEGKENYMAKYTGAQVIARMLEDYGVTDIFHVPAILRRTMVELEATSVRRIRAHSEKSAAYMADGYARASRRPGICMAQTVGALNLAAGLRDAWLAHSPVIAMTGGRDPSTKYRKVYQQNDDQHEIQLAVVHSLKHVSQFTLLHCIHV